MAASEVSLAAPTPKNHPGGFSAGPAVSFPASPLETMSPMPQGRRGTPAGLGRALPPSSPPPRAGSHGILRVWRDTRLVLCFGGFWVPQGGPHGVRAQIRTVGLGAKRGGWGAPHQGGKSPMMKGRRRRGRRASPPRLNVAGALSYNPRHNHQNLSHPVSPREGALMGPSHSPAAASTGRSCRLGGRR